MINTSILNHYSLKPQILYFKNTKMFSNTLLATIDSLRYFKFRVF